jgi:hypothetical protein
MTKIYQNMEIRDKCTPDELMRAKFIEIKAARFCEKAFGEEDGLFLELQKYPKKGQVNLILYYGFVGDICNKFMKKGMKVKKTEDLVGRIIMGILNKDKPLLDGLLAYD